MEHPVLRPLGFLPSQFCRESIIASSLSQDGCFVFASRSHTEPHQVALCRCNPSHEDCKTMLFLSFKEEIYCMEIGIWDSTEREETLVVLIVQGVSGCCWVFALFANAIFPDMTYDVPNDQKLSFLKFFSHTEVNMKLIRLVMWDFLGWLDVLLEGDSRSLIEGFFVFEGLLPRLIEYFKVSSNQETSFWCLVKKMISEPNGYEDVALIKFGYQSRSKIKAPSILHFDAINLDLQTEHQISSGILIGNKCNDTVILHVFGLKDNFKSMLKDLDSAKLKLIFNNDNIDVITCEDRTESREPTPDMFLHTFKAVLEPKYSAKEKRYQITTEYFMDTNDQLAEDRKDLPIQSVLINGPVDSCLTSGPYFVFVTASTMYVIDICSSTCTPKEDVVQRCASFPLGSSGKYRLIGVMNDQKTQSRRFGFLLGEQNSLQLIDFETVRAQARVNGDNLLNVKDIFSGSSYVNDLLEMLCNLRREHDNLREEGMYLDQSLSELSSAISLSGSARNVSSGIFCSIRPVITLAGKSSPSKMIIEVVLHNKSLITIRNDAWSIVISPLFYSEGEKEFRQFETFSVKLPMLSPEDQWSHCFEVSNIISHQVCVPVYLAFTGNLKLYSNRIDKPYQVFLLRCMRINCLDFLNGYHAHHVNKHEALHRWRFRIGIPKRIYGLKPNLKDVLTSFIPESKKSLQEIVPDVSRKSMMDAFNTGEVFAREKEEDTQELQGIVPREHYRDKLGQMRISISHAQGISDWSMVGSSLAPVDVSCESNDFDTSLAAHKAFLQRWKDMKTSFRSSNNGIQMPNGRILRLSPVASDVVPRLSSDDLGQLEIRLIDLRSRFQKLNNRIRNASLSELARNNYLQELKSITDQLRNMTCDMTFSV